MCEIKRCELYQTTLKSSFTLEGIGVHRGKKCSVTVSPADEDCGVIFFRSDDSKQIVANYKNVVNSMMCTQIANENGTLQTYNGVFMTNANAANPAFVGKLADYFAEAYQLDFNNDKDVDKMLGWIDDRVDEKKFMTAKDLNVNEDSAMYVISTLYFKNKWYYTFSDDKSKEGTFFSPSGERKVTYMRHSYGGDVYHYGDYVACYDYYMNGMKVKYILPTDSAEADIFTLIEGVNFFTDDENAKLKPESDGEYGEYFDDSIIINLTVPRLKSEQMIDFSDILKACGIKKAFKKTDKSFNYAFTDLGAEESIYLDFVKQKNKVSFDEDGTTVKSVTVSGMMGTAESGYIVMDTIDITLDRPFIYVIYDDNDLPVFVGNVIYP